MTQPNCMGPLFHEICMERAHQVKDNGFDAAHDAALSPNDWIAILSRHVGLAANDEAGHDPVRYRRQLVRIAATTVAALEAFDAARLAQPKVAGYSPEEWRMGV